jgi:hypothetical protein
MSSTAPQCKGVGGDQISGRGAPPNRKPSDRKRDVSKKILPAFVNWHRDIDITAFGLKFVTRRIDYGVQKTLGNIEPLYQMRALLQICSHKGQPFFHA